MKKNIMSKNSRCNSAAFFSNVLVYRGRIHCRRGLLFPLTFDTAYSHFLQQTWPLLTCYSFSISKCFRQNIQSVVGVENSRRWKWLIQTNDRANVDLSKSLGLFAIWGFACHKHHHYLPYEMRSYQDKDGVCKYDKLKIQSCNLSWYLSTLRDDGNSVPGVQAGAELAYWRDSGVCLKQKQTWLWSGALAGQWNLALSKTNSHSTQISIDSVWGISRANWAVWSKNEWFPGVMYQIVSINRPKAE